MSAPNDVGLVSWPDLDFACECCDQRAAIGVFAVPGVPLSIRWCDVCLHARVIPLWVAAAMVGQAPNGLADFTDPWLGLIERTMEYFRLSFEDLALAAIADPRQLNDLPTRTGSASSELPWTIVRSSRRTTGSASDRRST